MSSGYRLSLLYDIVQPIAYAAQRPLLPEMQGATQRLHHVLLSWKQDLASPEASEASPAYLACLLQHKYQKTVGFTGKALRGADALLLSHLYPLARELGFRIHIAHVELTATSSCSAPDYGYGYGGGFGGYGGRHGGYGRRCVFDESDEEDYDSDIDDCEFESDDEEGEEEYLRLRVKQIVDLRGLPVHVGDLHLDTNDVINGEITDGDPDEEELERHDRMVCVFSCTGGSDD